MTIHTGTGADGIITVREMEGMAVGMVAVTPADMVVGTEEDMAVDMVEGMADVAGLTLKDIPNMLTQGTDIEDIICLK